VRRLSMKQSQGHSPRATRRLLNAETRTDEYARRDASVWLAICRPRRWRYGDVWLHSASSNEERRCQGNRAADESKCSRALPNSQPPSEHEPPHTRPALQSWRPSEHPTSVVHSRPDRPLANFTSARHTGRVALLVGEIWVSRISPPSDQNARVT
jgi:hypothetical protein